MSKREPYILVEDILTAINKIDRYTTAMGRKTFLADDKTIDAVVRNLEIIGEAVRQLPEDFKGSHAGLPWSQMSGLRNRIIHDYFGLDLEIIWQVITVHLPHLKTQILAINR